MNTLEIFRFLDEAAYLNQQAVLVTLVSAVGSSVRNPDASSIESQSSDKTGQVTENDFTVFDQTVGNGRALAREHKLVARQHDAIRNIGAKHSSNTERIRGCIEWLNDRQLSR